MYFWRKSTFAPTAIIPTLLKLLRLTVLDEDGDILGLEFVFVKYSKPVLRRRETYVMILQKLTLTLILLL